MIAFLPPEIYDHESSCRWAQIVAAAPRRCYWNALDALRRSRGSLGCYVEGFVKATTVVFPHGWIETTEGRVIDPTFPVCNGNDAEEPYRYLPVLRFTLAELKGKRVTDFPLYCDGGRNFRKEREEPWHSAMRFVYLGDQ